MGACGVSRRGRRVSELIGPRSIADITRSFDKYANCQSEFYAAVGTGRLEGIKVACDMRGLYIKEGILVYNI